MRLSCKRPFVFGVNVVVAVGIDGVVELSDCVGVVLFAGAVPFGGRVGKPGNVLLLADVVPFVGRVPFNGYVPLTTPVIVTVKFDPAIDVELRRSINVDELFSVVSAVISSVPASPGSTVIGAARQTSSRQPDSRANDVNMNMITIRVYKEC